MKHRTKVFAIAITVSGFVIGTTVYALAASGSGGGPTNTSATTTWTMERSCGRHMASESGYEVVSWKPIILKAMVAHPMAYDFTVSAIKVFCIGTSGVIGPHGPATAMSEHGP